MKAILAVMFLTVVGFGMNSWGETPPSVVPVLSSADLMKQRQEWNDAEAKEKAKCPDDFSPGNPPTQFGGGNQGRCNTSKKDIQSNCASLEQRYGTDAASAQDKLDQKQKDAQDSAATLQEKIQTAQQDATDKIQKLKEDGQTLDAKYQEKQLETQKNNQKDSMDLANQTTKQQSEITKMTNRLPLVQNTITAANNSYTAVVNANSIAMVRMKCMSIIRKWMRENGVGATIKGGSGNAGSQQQLMNDQWNSCVSTEQANAAATIANANSSIMQAQEALNNLNSELAAAKNQLAQMQSVSSQQQQFQQTASTSSASNYYQQKMNLQQNLMTTQQNAQQKINSLNQQLMKKNMTSAKPMGGVNRQLDSDLSAYQSSCCKEGKRLPALGSGPTSEEDDSQSGEGLCGDLPSTATADQISPMSQAMQGMAPALMQRVMGNSGGFQ